MSNIVRGRTTVIKSILYTDNGITRANLAGAEVRCIVKKDKRDTDANALFVKTIGLGIIVTDEPNGEVETTFSAADINVSQAYGKVFYEVTARLAGGHFIGHGYETLDLTENIQNNIY